jgi:hypothetical protein
LGYAFDLLLVDGWAEKDGELVTSNTGDQVGAQAFGCKSATNFNQTLIANVVSECIVDLFKTIEVDEHERASWSMRFTDFGEPGLKLGAVGKAGHHVMLGNIPHSFEQSLLLGNVLLDAEEADRFAVSALDGGGYSDPPLSGFRIVDFGIKPEIGTRFYGFATSRLHTGKRFFRIAPQDLATHDPAATLKTEQVVGSVAPDQPFAGQFALPDAHARRHSGLLENLGIRDRVIGLPHKGGLMFYIPTQLPNGLNVERAEQGGTPTAQERIKPRFGGMNGVAIELTAARFRATCWSLSVVFRNPVQVSLHIDFAARDTNRIQAMITLLDIYLSNKPYLLFPKTSCFQGRSPQHSAGDEHDSARILLHLRLLWYQ